MDSDEQQDKRGQPEETRAVGADAAPIIAAGIVAGGQIIAAKITAGSGGRG